jgi:hypothetical protein
MRYAAMSGQAAGFDSRLFTSTRPETRLTRSHSFSPPQHLASGRETVNRATPKVATRRWTFGMDRATDRDPKLAPQGYAGNSTIAYASRQFTVNHPLAVGSRQSRPVIALHPHVGDHLRVGRCATGAAAQAIGKHSPRSVAVPTAPVERTRPPTARPRIEFPLLPVVVFPPWLFISRSFGRARPCVPSTTSS